MEKFEPQCLSAIRILLRFSRHISRKLWQATCIGNRDGFAVDSLIWPSGTKGEWRVRSWLAILTHVKKYNIFHMCCYSLSQSWKSLYNTAVYMINACLREDWVKVSPPWDVYMASCDLTGLSLSRFFLNDPLKRTGLWLRNDATENSVGKIMDIKRDRISFRFNDTSTHRSDVNFKSINSKLQHLL